MSWARDRKKYARQKRDQAPDDDFMVVSAPARRKTDPRVAAQLTAEAVDVIHVTSSDGFEFAVPRSAACHSGLLKAIYEERSEGEEIFPAGMTAQVLQTCLEFAVSEHIQFCRPGLCIAFQDEAAASEINFFFSAVESSDAMDIGTGALLLDIPGLVRCCARIAAHRIASNECLNCEGYPVPLVAELCRSLRPEKLCEYEHTVGVCVDTTEIWQHHCDRIGAKPVFQEALWGVEPTKVQLMEAWVTAEMIRRALLLNSALSATPSDHECDSLAMLCGASIPVNPPGLIPALVRATGEWQGTLQKIGGLQTLDMAEINCLEGALVEGVTEPGAVREFLMRKTEVKSACFRGNQLDEEASAALVQGLQLTILALTHLDLSGNFLGANGIESLGAAIRNGCPLQTLLLARTLVGPDSEDAVDILLQSIAETPGLTQLDISFNDLALYSVSAALSQASSLQQLDFSGNHLRIAHGKAEGSFAELWEACKAIQLEEVSVAACLMGLEPLYRLCIDPWLRLTTLDISQNELINDQVVCISPLLQTLLCLRMYSIGASSTAAEWLAQQLPQSVLAELHVHRNHMRLPSVLSLLRAAIARERPIRLNLDMLPVSDEGVVKLRKEAVGIKHLCLVCEVSWYNPDDKMTRH